MSVISQLPPALDVAFVAGNPFAIAVTSTGATITSPAVTMRTQGGDAYTTDPGIPTVSQLGAVTSISFTAADTAALNTGTGGAKFYRWSLQALVNGTGPYELVAKNVKVYPVGTAASSTSTSVTLDIIVGGAAVSLSVAVGAGMTAADILTVLKTVDGAGSGLDADLLDGISSAGFEVAGAAAAAVATHAGLPDPHPGYLTSAEGNATYAQATTAILAADGTDQTATFQAAINTAMGASGNGWLFIPVNGTIRIDGQITFPNDAGAVPKQRGLRITGLGASHSGQGSAPYGGTILDMRYAGGTKMVTYGLGRLVLEHLTLRDTTDGTQNFIQTTNTTLWINDVEFYGKTATTPVQDAIVLGGTSSALDGTSNAAFQGYGTIIQNNHFNNIRRGVYGRTFCNGTVIRDNTWWIGCGADSTAAAVEFLGHVTDGTCSGNIVEGNIIEMQNYVYAVKSAYTINCVFGPNGLYDAGVGTLGHYYFTATAQYNLVIDGYRVDAKALIVETGASVGTNTTLTAHQTQTSVFAQPIKLVKASEVAADLTFTAGASGVLVLQPAASASDSHVMIRAKRSAAEGTNPSTAIFELQQNGNISIGGSAAGNFNFYDAAHTLIGQFTGAGKNWIAAGSGGAMSINSGSGGSYLTLQNYGVILKDHTGANSVTLKNGSGSPEGAFAAPVGSHWFRTDGGLGTTHYVKETGAATNAGWVAQGSPVAASTGWAVSNVTTDKVLDANATSIDEIADVVGTLITYLISRGVLTA